MLLVCLCVQAMESKLLRGGKNIVDHTNEQQRALEQRRQEIAEQQVSRDISPRSCFILSLNSHYCDCISVVLLLSAYQMN